MGSSRLESTLMLERNPWKQAFQRLSEANQSFLVRIEEDNKAATNPDHIVKEIIELIHQKSESTLDEHSIPESNAETARAKKLFETIITWLHRFIAIGDGAVQHDMSHALLPWLAIRASIQRRTTPQQRMAEIDQLELICCLLQQSRLLEVRYNSGTMQHLRRNVHKHLANLWTSLISLYTVILESLVCTSLNPQQEHPFKQDMHKPEKVMPHNYLDELHVQGQCLEERAITCHKVYNEEYFHRLHQSFQAVTNRLLKRLPKGVAPPRGIDDHLLLQDNRSPDACAWILNDPKYQDWKHWISRVAILYGPAGVGKTFLVSRIIDDIRMTCIREGLADGVAYSYFHHDRKLRDPDSLGELDSLIKRFIRQLGVKPIWYPEHEGPGVYKRILSLRPSRRLSRPPLGTSQYRKILSELIDEYATVTFVLDGLNECDPNEQQAVLDFLDDLVRQHYPRVRVFCSSRHDVEVSRYFKSRPIVKIKALSRKDDIPFHVYRLLTKQFPKESRELKARISQAILDKDDTSLQLTSLQIKYLSSSSTTEGIQQRLKELPTTLDATYHCIFSKIQEDDVHRDFKVFTAMKWILCAKTQLSNHDIELIMQLDPTTDVSFVLDDPHGLSLDTTIDQLSLNLLAYCDAGTTGWHYYFDHRSACEYFEQQYCSLRAAKLFVATSCLKWFVFERRSEQKHCLDRAQLQFTWLDHLDYGEAFDTEGEKRLVQLLKLFLGSFDTASTHFAAWTNDNYSSQGNKTLPGGFKLGIYGRFRNERPIILACSMIPYRFLSDWWEDTSVDLDQCSSKGQSLLELSLLFRNTSVWRFLLQREVSVNHGLLTPLNVAIKNQITEAIELLLDAGADVNRMGPSDCKTCLSEAVCQDDLELMQKLIDYGANLNQQHVLKGPKDLYATSPLFEACIAAKNPETIRLLLDSGANINLAAPQGCRYSSPLHAALCTQNWAAVKVLLEHGVDTRLGGAGGNILDVIDKPACHPILGALIESGLKPTNLHQCLLETITGACCRGSTACIHRREVFQMFLDIGADINGTDGGRSAAVLAVAAYECDISILDFLLHRGADINFVSDSPLQETALCAAASQGWTDTVKFLVEAGADVNKGTQFVTPLIRTFTIETDKSSEDMWLHIERWQEEEERYLECTRILLEAGANVNAVCPEGHHGTALSAAYFVTSEDVEETLANFCADINLASPWQSPLCALVKRQYYNKYHIKFKSDPRVNPDTILTRGFGSALAIAAYYAFFHHAYILLRKQKADPNLELKGWFKNALEAAMCGSVAEASGGPSHIARRKHLQVIRLLLKQGAKPPMPILNSPELPVEYVLRQSGREYRIHSAVTSHKWPLRYSMRPLSPTWGGIICELTSIHPRGLRKELRRWSFPNDLPAFYVIGLKVEPSNDSGTRDPRFAFIVLYRSCAKLWFLGTKNLSPPRQGIPGVTFPKSGRVNTCSHTPALQTLVVRTAVAVTG